MTNKERKEIRVLVRTVQETQKKNKSKEEARIERKIKEQGVFKPLKSWQIPEYRL